MISKHISCKPENDNYKRLANYIARSEANKSFASEARTTLLASEVSRTTCRNESDNVASHKGEKCLHSWCTGTLNADDYALSIEEVVSTQAQNLRTTREKTYHLIVSLRMEDEGKLSEQDYQTIEQEFAKTLGFQTHQRHCGVHKNTDNLHMHIAYNMINPETFRRHEPFRDYYALEKTCRAMEQKYNLSIDNGIEKDDSYKLSNNSTSKEARTGEESFERYVINRHDKIMQELEKAQTWEDVHHVFAKYGLELVQRGNGLSIKNRKGRQSVKASKFDKELSHKKMLEKFGNFQKQKMYHSPKDWYQKKPLDVDFSSALWQEFIQSNRTNDIKEIKEKWHKEKIRITGLAVTRRARRELLKQTHIKQQAEINEYRQAQSFKSQNWLEFLQEKAKDGNEEALLCLLLTSEKQLPGNLEINARGGYRDKLLNEKEILALKQKFQASNLNPSSKRALIAVELFKKTTSEDFTFKITNRGAIIFELVSGGKVIDSGKEITCTQGREELAEQYKDMKMGRSVSRVPSKGLAL